MLFNLKFYSSCRRRPASSFKELDTGLRRYDAIYVGMTQSMLVAKRARDSIIIAAELSANVDLNTKLVH